MPRKERESFGLELLDPNGTSSKKICEFVFDRCIKALNKHRDKKAPVVFAREAIRRFGKFVARDDILLAIVTAEWVIICRRVKEKIG